MEIFKKNLKQERLIKGLTQKEFADTLGISFIRYRKYESMGKGSGRMPDPELIVQIADALNISLDELFGRK